MSDAQPFAFGKFIPGFDFLQQLAAGAPGKAGGADSSRPHWVAPTVSVDELDKRITELKAVQFWLEQNTTAVKATVQALEVQKMTLATLEGMNLSMAEVAKAFTLPAHDRAASPAADERPSGQWPYGAAPTTSAAPAPQPPATAPEASAAESPAAPEPAPAAAPAAAGVADPMAWWGALTQQFQQIAAGALREAVHAMPDAAPGAAQAAAPTHPGARPAKRAGANTAARKAKTAAKPTAARKPRAPATPPAARASAKAAARPARKATAKPAGPRAAPKPEPARADSGWPLPPPFKFR